MNIFSYLFNRFVPSQSPFLSPETAHSQQPAQSQSVDCILQQLKQAIPSSRLTTCYGQDELVIRITWGEKGVSSQDVASETPLQRNNADNQEKAVKGETTHTRQHRLMKRLIPFFEENYRFRYNSEKVHTRYGNGYWIRVRC